jgi:hypothetical protein
MVCGQRALRLEWLPPYSARTQVCTAPPRENAALSPPGHRAEGSAPRGIWQSRLGPKAP